MSRRGTRLLLLILILLGIALRLEQWAYRAPVWHDEAAVIHNVESKDARQLMGPLLEEVAAPPGFLLTLRGLYKCFGDSSLIYRLPALVCGSAALVFFALLAAELLAPEMALVITALFALSDRVIWHTVEIKPYSIDAFFACLMLWLFISIQRPARRIVAISLVGIAGIWFSFPVLFVFGGLMIAELWENDRNRRAIGAAILGGILFLLSLSAVYFLDVRPQRTPGLRGTWAVDYLPASPGAWPGWFIFELYQLGDYSTKNMGGLALVLMVLGAAYLYRRRKYRELRALVLPIALTLAAACASLYPFGGSRATLFLVPAIFLLCGFGLEFVAAWRAWGIFVARAVGLFLIAWMAGLAAYHVISPRMRTPAIRDLAGYVHVHDQKGDVVYVWAGRNGPGEFIDYWKHHVHQPGVPAIPLGEGKYAGRFWIVLVDATQFRKTIAMPGLTAARAAAVQKAHFTTRGGEVYLFQQPAGGISLKKNSENPRLRHNSHPAF